MFFPWVGAALASDACPQITNELAFKRERDTRTDIAVLLEILHHRLANGVKLWITKSMHFHWLAPQVSSVCQSLIIA